MSSKSRRCIYKVSRRKHFLKFKPTRKQIECNSDGSKRTNMQIKHSVFVLSKQFFPINVRYILFDDIMYIYFRIRHIFLADTKMNLIARSEVISNSRN